uniref:Reverse transcriptase domain-containing protein n=1 Tax=Tanacetum cinerariifolium TaxID=118510 RepID=A0A6L2MJ49_TANCI|nr:hypothetical protein [Tanacetum cinerariifolium]
MLKKHEHAVNLVVQQKQEEQAAQIFTPNWDFSMINDDEEHSIQYKEYLENSSNTIATVLPTEELEYSLSMGEEHLSTILKTKSDEVIKSSVKNLVQIPIFTTFSNPIFDDNDNFTSSDDESLSNEDVPMEIFQNYLNPLFDDEEINSDEIDPHYFNAESDLIKSLSNRDTLFDSSFMFDYLDEFSGELLPTSIIDEEIDVFTGTYDLTPPGIEKPPNVEIFFKFDACVLTTNVVKGIFEHDVLMPNIFPTLPTFDLLYPVYDTLLPFSSKNGGKVFKPGILSYLLVSHRDKTTSGFFENPMMMYGGDIPLLDVSYLHFYPP